MSNSFLIDLAKVLNIALEVYMWMIIIRVLISWVNPNPYNKVVQFLGRFTDPVLRMTSRMTRLSWGGIDFSPIILIVFINFLQLFLVNTLMQLGMGRPTSVILPIFIISAVRLIQGLLFAFMVVLIIRAVLSWISPDPYNPIVRITVGITEPLLRPIRNTLPLVFGGVDLTPIALVIIIYLVNGFLDRLLLSL